MAKPGLGRRHQTIAAILRRQAAAGEPCWICGRPINLDAPPRTRWAFSVDHLTPRSKGGQTTLANSAVAHYGCNSKRGNRTRSTSWRPRRW